MTEMLKKEFSRSSFLKGGGAMVVGFSLVGAGLGAKVAKAAGDPYASNGPFDAQAIDSWLTIHADNTVTLRPGAVEIGQGTVTGLLMVAAEELNVSMSQMRNSVNNDTNVTPVSFYTAGSSGIASGSLPVRAAAAAAKNALLDLAATNLGVAKASLTVKDGVVSGGGKTVTYGALLGDKLFNVRSATALSLAAGAPGAKAVADYGFVSKHGTPRVDIPAKVNGTFTYVHNIKVPGMIHGRVVRPRGQGAYGAGTAPKVLSIDEGSIAKITGAKVVRFGDFVGVVAPTEYAAIQASAQLKVKWADMPKIAAVGNVFKQMRDHDTAGKAPARIAASAGNFSSAFANAAVKVSQSYTYDYNGSMPIGPCCAVADVTPSGARVFTNSQNLYGTRASVKTALDTVLGANTLPLNKVRLTYFEGSSTYGPAAAWDDAAQAAAIMSAVTGKPVRLQLMRWDEHGWSHYGPAQLTDVRGGVDASGNLVAFEYTQFGIPYFTTNHSQQMITGTAQYATAGNVDTTISGSQYNIPNRTVIGKSLPLQDNYFKTTFLRAPVAPQSAFAAEQLIDELAYGAKMDPVAFRLKNIAQPTSPVPDVALRWKNALEGVARISNWKPKVAASNLSDANVVTGRGVAFGHFANSRVAAVADIQVNKKTGKITVNHVYVASDAGLIVYPDGMHNNEEGAIMQGVSRALTEVLTFNTSNVTSLDWVSYPMVRFKDAPKITLEALQRSDVPVNDTTSIAAGGSRSTGSGEPGLVPVSPAIANAFFDATGVRIRQAPMTPGRVRAVLAAAGS
jgi:CO/xanthine dehydrogenase Mo-binding subunit